MSGVDDIHKAPNRYPLTPQRETSLNLAVSSIHLALIMCILHSSWSSDLIIPETTSQTTKIKPKIAKIIIAS